MYSFFINQERDQKIDGIATSGVGLAAQFLLQMFLGILMSLSYSPAIPAAHRYVAQMRLDPFWAFVQRLHYWGSALLIVHAGLHLAAILWAGRTSGDHRARYLASLGMFGLALAYQITGNVLPYDRHGVQTAAIEGSIAARVPGVGPAASRLIMGGDGFSVATMELWYALHRFVLPVALLAVLLMAAREYRAKRDVRFDVRLAAVPILALVLFAGFVASPFGSVATAADARGYDALPSWYTYPAHLLLAAGQKAVPNGGWIGAILLPGLIGFAMVLLAWKPVPPAITRYAMGAAAVLLLVGGLTSPSRFASLTGTRDPVGVKSVVVEKAKPQDPILAAKGKVAFDAVGCAGCHGANGKASDGGPRLTDIHKEHSDADFYIRYIKNPTSVKASSTMPAFPDLKKEELSALAEFLRYPIPTK
jgi:mono/diheme cytochrome c family protein